MQLRAFTFTPKPVLRTPPARKPKRFKLSMLVHSHSRTDSIRPQPTYHHCKLYISHAGAIPSASDRGIRPHKLSVALSRSVLSANVFHIYPVPAHAQFQLAGRCGARGWIASGNSRPSSSKRSPGENCKNQPRSTAERAGGERTSELGPILSSIGG